MKFFYDLFRAGRTREQDQDFEARPSSISCTIPFRMEFLILK
jgi:hypothetical protein